jgi:hypothetical protein
MPGLHFNQYENISIGVHPISLNLYALTSSAHTHMMTCNILRWDSLNVGYQHVDSGYNLLFDESSQFKNIRVWNLAWCVINMAVSSVHRDVWSLPNISISAAVGINVQLGSKVRRVRHLPPSLSRLSRQCGILNISQTYRPPRPVTGIASLIFTIPSKKMYIRVTSMKIWDDGKSYDTIKRNIPLKKSNVVSTVSGTSNLALKYNDKV